MVIQTVEFRERNCPWKNFFRESPYVVLINQIWDIRRPISLPLDVTTKLGHFPVILRKHLLSSKVTWSQRLQPRACGDYTPPPKNFPVLDRSQKWSFGTPNPDFRINPELWQACIIGINCNKIDGISIWKFYFTDNCYLNDNHNDGRLLFFISTSYHWIKRFQSKRRNYLQQEKRKLYMYECMLKFIWKDRCIL